MPSLAAVLWLALPVFLSPACAPPVSMRVPVSMAVVRIAAAYCRHCLTQPCTLCVWCDRMLLLVTRSKK